MDFIVKDLVVVEVKRGDSRRSRRLSFRSVDVLIPIHQAQVLTYLRLSGCRLGLLINGNVPSRCYRVRSLPRLKDGGIKRIVLGLNEILCCPHGRLSCEERSNHEFPPNFFSLNYRFARRLALRWAYGVLCFSAFFASLRQAQGRL